MEEPTPEELADELGQLSASGSDVQPAGSASGLPWADSVHSHGVHSHGYCGGTTRLRETTRFFLSMRDEFILKRARALWSRSFKFTAGYKPIWSWRRRFEGNELRNPQPSCDRENDFLDGNSVEHRHASRGQLATPARSGGKKRAGGRKS